MFLFWRLILSHVLGDFPLQTDTIYYLKVKAKWGRLLHGLVFILLNFLLGWPYLSDKLVLSFLIAIGLLHALTDGMKITFKSRYYQGETILTFLSDQFIHIAIICLIIPLRRPPPALLSSHGLASLYYNDIFIFYAIAYTFASFGGLIFSTALKNTFAKTIVSVDLVPPLQKFYGLIERAIIAFLVMRGFNLWPVLVAISPRLVPPLKRKIGGWSDVFINYCLGLTIGLILRSLGK